MCGPGECRTARPNPWARLSARGGIAGTSCWRLCSCLSDDFTGLVNRVLPTEDVFLDEGDLLRVSRATLGCDYENLYDVNKVKNRRSNGLLASSPPVGPDGLMGGNGGGSGFALRLPVAASGLLSGGSRLGLSRRRRGLLLGTGARRCPRSSA